MRRMPSLLIAAACVTATSVATLPAEAACKKMGFLVNDYGKDGPTKDAQQLLEKDIAKWAAGQGITNYTVSNRDVKCELYLDVILFDEHTCTASASVCWDEKNPNAKPAEKSAAGDAPAKPAVNKAAAKTDGAEKKTEASEKPATKTAGKEATDTPTMPAALEATGAIPETKPAAASTGSAVSTAAADEAAKSAAAAERAAQAAERAAAAAERAAAATASAPSTPAAPPASAPVETVVTPAMIPDVSKDAVVAPVQPTP